MGSHDHYCSIIIARLYEKFPDIVTIRIKWLEESRRWIVTFDGSQPRDPVGSNRHSMNWAYGQLNSVSEDMAIYFSGPNPRWQCKIYIFEPIHESHRPVDFKALA